MSQKFLGIWAGVPLIPGHFRRRIVYRCDLYARVRCDLLCLKGCASRAIASRASRHGIACLWRIGTQPGQVVYNSAPQGCVSGYYQINRAQTRILGPPRTPTGPDQITAASRLQQAFSPDQPPSTAAPTRNPHSTVHVSIPDKIDYWCKMPDARVPQLHSRPPNSHQP